MKKIIQKYKFQKLIEERVKNDKKVMLHIGCGRSYFDGWINIDNNSDNNIDKLDINFDLRMSLPIRDNSVDYIFNEHFLEHLTVEEGQRSLRDFLRILKPDGVMRIAMPDLRVAIDRYFDPNWKNDPAFKKFGLSYETRAEMINTSFRAWGHKWLYDAEELGRRLKESGGINIKQCNLRESDYAELIGLETRDESTLIMEVKKRI
jgi:predicted SAM-dependent methyltransferase